LGKQKAIMTTTNLLSTKSPNVLTLTPLRDGTIVCGNEALRSSKVMIVDDEPINVKLAQKFLSLGGYRNFITTNESREAVSLVNLEQPDVLLLDIMMPHVSGLDILAQLRAEKRWAHLPIVILTASTESPILALAAVITMTHHERWPTLRRRSAKRPGKMNDCEIGLRRSNPKALPTRCWPCGRVLTMVVHCLPLGMGDRPRMPTIWCWIASTTLAAGAPIRPFRCRWSRPWLPLSATTWGLN
jgi:CheY-like chemotaxis protein